jgi:threonine aldolase
MEGNGVFAELPHEVAVPLQQDWRFHVWSATEDGTCVVRWMTAFNTSPDDVDGLLAAVSAGMIHVKPSPA